MIVPLEKPGTPEELIHFGVKGMKWGVRKEQATSGLSRSTKNEQFWTPERKSTAKKVAIGVGALAVVAGAAFVAYKLNANGKQSVSSLKTTAKAATETRKILSEPTDIIYNARGKTKGLQFFKKGGVPDYFTHYENTLGKWAHVGGSDLFEKLPDGRIMTRFLDPLGRVDGSGRRISHEALIPKTMSAGIENNTDVVKKIWPVLKDIYDPT